MGRKLFAKILESLKRVRAYASGKPPEKKRTHYFAMSPEGKMVRKTLTHPRKSKSRTRKKRR